jgi:hypothetical protein
MLRERDINVVRYMIVCVSEFANRFNIDDRDAFNYLKEHKAIKFLIDNYEIEHTLSLEDAVEDMIMVSRNNGGFMQ